MAEATSEKCWRDLRTALEAECGKVDGYGKVTLRITFHGGVPKGADVVGTEPTYRFGNDPRFVGETPGIDRGKPAR